jgi:death-on-curing protein
VIGGDPPIDYLTIEDLLEVADDILPEVLVRDIGLLAAAAERPRASAFGEDAYPLLVDKAAALMHSLARSHTLVDGNKRLAWAATRVFLLLNDRDLHFSVDEAESVVVSVAAGDIDVRQLARILAEHLT